MSAHQRTPVRSAEPVAGQDDDALTRIVRLAAMALHAPVAVLTRLRPGAAGGEVLAWTDRHAADGATEPPPYLPDGGSDERLVDWRGGPAALLEATSAAGPVLLALAVLDVPGRSWDAHDRATLRLLVPMATDAATDAAARAAAREVRRPGVAARLQEQLADCPPDAPAVLRLVVQRALELAPHADGAAVELLEGGRLRTGAAAGSLLAAARPRRGLGLASSRAVLATGRPAQFDAPTDAPADALTDAADEGAGETVPQTIVGSLVVAPVPGVGGLRGVVTVTSSVRGAFGPADVEQLGLVAGILGAALRHGEDYRRISRLAEEQALALTALEVGQERFRLAFDASPVAMCLTSLLDDGAEYLQVNAAMAELTGYSCGQLLAMSFRDLHHRDDLADSEAVLARLRSGELAECSALKRYVHASGRLVWVQLRTAVVRDDDGTPLYLVTQLADVTERRAAQSQLEQQAGLLDLARAAVVVRDLDGTVRFWNRGAEQTYGWTRAQALQRRAHRLLATELPDGLTQDRLTERLLRDGGWEGEVRHRCADGRTVTVLSRQALQRGPDGEPVAVLEINADITDRRTAELALAESEQRFRAQFDHAAVGQLVRGLDGTVLDANPALALMLGCGRADLIGTDVRRIEHPDDAATPGLAAVFAGDRDASRQEQRLRHRDGRWIEADVTLSVVRDAAGDPLHLVCIVQAIGDRKRAERERDDAARALGERNRELVRSNEQLAAANALRLDLMGMLSHEIGTPLTSIIGYAEAALDVSEPGAEHLPPLEAVLRAGWRLAGIRTDVLDMCRVDSGCIVADREAVSLGRAVEQALADEELTVPVLGDPSLVALVNPVHLQHVLANLLHNAAKYAGGATAVRLGLSGSTVTVAVQDRGPGVGEDFRRQLFERFTREEGRGSRGTGLGLYIVRGLLEANSATIEHRPRPHGGSSFVIGLQAVLATAGPQQRARADR